MVGLRAILFVVRPVLIAWVVVMTSAALIAPPVVEVVAAKRKKKKRKKRTSGRKAIKREKALSAKKQIELDEEIGQAEELKDLIEREMNAEAGPALTAEDFEVEKESEEDISDTKLKEEIVTAEQILKLETTCEGLAPAEARLADLYWERSKKAFFKSQDFSTAQSKREKYVRLMTAYQEKTVAHYTHIIDTCEGEYDAFAKILFNLGRTLSEMDRHEEGAPYFKRIIKEYASSKWVADAWFMVGEYYFNHKNDAKLAYKAYLEAEKFPNSPVYGFAMYKQGWCHINTGRWDLALEQFERVIKISEDPKRRLDKKRRLSLRKEALKDFVRAYSHVGWAQDAYKTFFRLGGKEHVMRMMENLGNWYISRDAHDDVMQVYNELIKQYKDSTRKPIYQGRIVNAADKQGDDKRTVKEVKLLTKYFKEVRSVLERSRKLAQKEKARIGKDLAEAEDIAEKTLRRLAMEYHKEAKKLPEHSKTQIRRYEYARDLYKHYLEVFPEPNPKATVNYVFFMRYYFAEVLFYLADASPRGAAELFGEAAKNYDIVIAMNPNPKKAKDKQIVNQAVEDSVRAYDEVVQEIERKNPPEIEGTESKPVPEIKMKLIKACQRYIDHFGKSGEEVVEIRYKVARIYYTYNHLDKAAPAFNDIVENHPGHDVACIAANLALDIHNLDKDYHALKKLTRAYRKNSALMGVCDRTSDEGPGAERDKFAKIEEQAAFFIIKEEIEEKKKYVEAGNAYMDFYREYGQKGTGRFAIDAVNNAAVNYDKGQRLDKANEVREFLVKTFQDSKDKRAVDLVRDTMWNIAQSYERVVDFDTASKYLENFAARYPNDPKTKDAIYNIGVYRTTLRDFRGGLAAREKYLSRWGDDKEAYNLKWQMCMSLEEEAKILEGKKDHKAAVKKWEAVHDCLWDWVKNPRYSQEHVDMLCDAQYRRGEIMRDKTKYAKGYQEQRKYLFKMWPIWEKKKGKEKLPRCATAVSEIMFRDIQPKYKRYADLRLTELVATPKGKATWEKSVAAKVKARDELIKEYHKIVEIGVPEWALASLFMIGEAFKNTIDRTQKTKIVVLDKFEGMRLKAEDKKVLDEQFRQFVEGQVAPVRDDAVKAYSLVVDTANRLGVYNQWSVKALKRLQTVRPEEYVPLVERLAPVSLNHDIEVEKNSVVLADKVGLMPMKQPLKDGVGVPSQGKKVKKPEAMPKPQPEPDKTKTKSRKKNKGKKRRGSRDTPGVAQRVPA